MPMNRSLRALARWCPRLLFNSVVYESVDRLGSGKDRALRCTPVVECRQKFIGRAHLERSYLRLNHASSCVECVDIWLTPANLRVITWLIRGDSPVMVFTIIGIWVFVSFAFFGVLGWGNRDVGLLHRAIDLQRKINFRHEVPRMLRRSRSRVTPGYGNWPEGE